MVYRAISKDIKDRVIWLIDHDYAPPDVCEFFGISERSIARWKKNQNVYGSPVAPPPLHRGRPRLLNADMTHDLFTLLQEAPEMYLDEIQEWLAVAHDTRIS